MPAVDVLLSPAAFLSTTLARTRSLRVRLSCRSAALFSFTLTAARPVLPIRKDLRPTVRTRVARVMFAVRVSTPLLPGSPATRMVSTPRLLIFTDPKRALLGPAGGGGGGGGGGTGFGRASARWMAGRAFTAPPVVVFPL